MKKIFACLVLGACASTTTDPARTYDEAVAAIGGRMEASGKVALQCYLATTALASSRQPNDMMAALTSGILLGQRDAFGHRLTDLADQGELEAADRARFEELRGPHSNEKREGAQDLLGGGDQAATLFNDQCTKIYGDAETVADRNTISNAIARQTVR